MKTDGQRGFTLIELMLAMGLSLVVAMALGHVVLTNLSLWQSSRRSADMQRNMTMVHDMIRMDINEARSLLVTAGGFSTRDTVGVVLHAYGSATTADGVRLQRDGVTIIPEELTSLTLTPNADTTWVTMDIALKSTDDARVTLRVGANVDNRTRDF